MAVKIGYAPPPPRKRSAKLLPKASGSKPCFHTIAPRLERKIVYAAIDMSPIDGRISVDIEFDEDEEPPPKYPDAATDSYMWQNADGLILTEVVYEIE